MQRFTKHPNAIRLFTVKVSNLGMSTITAAEFTGDEALSIGAATVAANSASSLIGGGESGQVYQVEAALTISNGERIVSEFEIEVLDQ